MLSELIVYYHLCAKDIRTFVLTRNSDVCRGILSIHNLYPSFKALSN